MEKAIIARNLYKTFITREGGIIRARKKRVEALRGVDLDIGRGVVYGLLGPNGAGKTTLVKILSTLIIPDSGEAYVLGHDVVKERDIVRERIGVMLSVERGFFWKLTGYENLKYFGMLHGLQGSVLEEKVRFLLELVGLTRIGGDTKLFEDMSLGMKARLGIARALINDPELIMLDEPTLGLDPASARHIRGLIKRLASSGRTVFITTHNMYEAEEVCDVVGIIFRGRIIAEGSPRELKNRLIGKMTVILRFKGDESSINRLVGKIASKYEASFSISYSNGHVTARIITRSGTEEDLIYDATVTALRSGIHIRESKIVEPTLEDLFLEVVGERG